MSLARNTLVQSSLTLGSRLLGFGRDLALSANFGQGALMDVWSTALMLPNMFRRLFAEGAFAQAFVPVYGGVRTRDGEAAATVTASEVMSFMFAVVAAFCILLQAVMPWIVPWLLSAWKDDAEVMRVAVIATQLAMPYLACMTIASLLSGVLNTGGRFALSAAVPVFLNLCTLAPLISGFVLPVSPATVLLATSAAVTVSGVIQAGLLWWGVRRLGVRLKLGLPRLTPTVKRALALAVPGAMAGGAMQVNSVVSQVLAGSDAGARSVLYNADRLYQLPLGLVGVAIGLALVPRLTKAFVSGDHEGGQKTLDDGINLAMAFTLPAAVALFVIPFFIIDATVTRGAFTSADAARTADVLRQFAWGVPAFVLAKVLTPPFFAREDTRRPMYFAITAVVITVVLGSALFFWFGALGWDGVLGLAIATSVSAWVNVGLLGGVLIRENSWRPSPAFVSRIARVLAASAVMAGLLLLAGINYGLLSRLLLAKEIAVLVVCGLGAGVYGACLLAFRAVTLSELKATLRREPGGSAVSGLD
ncbi:murein biosynthesis integral membrane protein MurJ [Brevundimonas sp.]|jgi:putative peptidoglycan lipid II flippase|uniref:murein biosynthesis integral membrane protein MurJ n=1 Tax=Brevundimonas sp. TaxID=1871086 RepID=UPI0017DC7EC3|nr:murein biosynthesis integral membrane protein MurJ [Brevundimonas sp.]MBA4808316.1 murein biosynthesis integral membrane protein MurJ [Brevundimonas sp.]